MEEEQDIDYHLMEVLQREILAATLDMDNATAARFLAHLSRWADAHSQACLINDEDIITL